VTVAGPDTSADVLRRHRLIEMVDGDRGGATRRGLPVLRTRLGRVCAVAVSEVRVDGAGVTVMGSLEGGLNGARDQLAATDDVARRLEDLQLTVGEGPCLDAYRAGQPVLAGDLAAEPARWPGFGPEAARVGAAAVFSLPLQVGAVRLGTLDLHRLTPGALAVEQLADALTLASLATEVLLELSEQTGADADLDPADPEAAPPAGWLPDVHAEVHVAAGMISARADVDVTVALLRLRSHAFGRGEPIHDVARRIIDRDLVLDHHDPLAGPLSPDLENDDS
jgi:hypothetical protein